MSDAPPNPAPGLLSRRQWLLRLGEATALLGFSGEFEIAPAPSAGAPGASATHLPPGLYEPSTEHLAHAYGSDGPYHFAPPGSETDYVQPRAGPYRPLFFTPSELGVVRRVAELLLGEAGPGAGASGARAEELGQTLAEWIDLRVSCSAGIRRAARELKPEHRALAAAVEGEESVSRLEESDPEAVCHEGLAWLEKNARATHGQTFMALGAAQQIELLRLISDEQRPPAAPNAGRKFFDLMKREVIHGFYTSRAGLAELDYKGNAFYAESPGCEPDQPK